MTINVDVWMHKIQFQFFLSYIGMPQGLSFECPWNSHPMPYLSRGARTDIGSYSNTYSAITVRYKNLKKTYIHRAINYCACIVLSMLCVCNTCTEHLCTHICIWNVYATHIWLYALDMHCIRITNATPIYASHKQCINIAFIHIAYA